MRALLLLALLGCQQEPATDDDTDTPAEDIVGILVTPDDVVLPRGDAVRLVATGLRADRTAVDLTAVVAWEVADPGVLQVDDGLDREGVLTGVAVGETTVTAVLGDVASPPAEVEVTEATVLGLSVQPATAELAPGQTLQLTATAAFSDGRSSDATGQVRWVTSDGARATVDATGLVTGRAEGAVSVAARLGELSSEPVSLQVRAGQPNLIIADLRPIEGGVQVVVQNAGAVGASDFWVDVFADPDQSPAVGATGDAFRRVGWVGPGEIVHVDLALDGQPLVVAALVDTNDDVEESNEDDNLLELLLPEPEGSVDVGIWEVEWIADEVSVYLFVTLVNYGDAPSGPFDLDVYEDRLGLPAPIDQPDATVRVDNVGAYAFTTAELLFDPACDDCDMWLWVDRLGALDDADPLDNVDGPWEISLEGGDTGWDTGW
jgi:hypothetical protein